MLTLITLKITSNDGLHKPAFDGIKSLSRVRNKHFKNSKFNFYYICFSKHLSQMKTGMSFLAKIVTTTLAVLFGAYILPGVRVDSALTAIVLSLVLSVLNILLKPLLILLTLPITILTLGLFLVVINALILLIAAAIVPGFVIDGFWWAVLFSILLTLFVSVLEGLQKATSGNKNGK